MKKILFLLCIVLAVTSCGVSNRTTADKQKVTVGICKNGSSKTFIKYFTKCVKDAGAKPYFFPAYATTDEMAREFVSQVDAVIIPGKAGADTAGRSKYDYKVIREALAQGKPILGICLGHQEINGVYGGKIGSIAKHYPDTEIKHKEKVDNFNKGINTEAHAMTIDTTSRLYAIYGQEHVMVNTSHGFSITKLGEGLKVVAVADDGVIEAIEDNSRNVMGVQYHPEALYGRLKLKKHLLIFKNLVKEARETKAARLAAAPAK